ncbi:MAG: radical SAM protein [Planctomycetes bacterium]|nr:radical SAM protein [Planctomycetota bacterium]
MRVLLVVYDNSSYIHYFPIGIAYIASALLREGHDVEIYSQDVHHYPEEHLTDYLNKNRFDIIGLGVTGGYYQYRKLLKISKSINAAQNRPEYYVIGGHGPSPEPDYFLKKTGADIVIIGEGEVSSVNLLNSISNKKSLHNVEGIAFRDGDDIVINPRQPLIKDVDSISWPAYSIFPIEYYRLFQNPLSAKNEFSMPLLSGRGCTFNCNFCYRMDKGFRARHSEAIVEEIKYLQKDYRISYIDFADELLMSSKKRTVELCKAFQRAKLKFKWSCNGRLNYASPDILKLMKDTGCVYCNYGIEAFDDDALKNMNKALTTKQIISGIEATLSVGISPGFNIIFGNIGENKAVLDKDVEFLLKYDDSAELRTIRPVTPYPGSQLYYYAIEKGLLKDVEDFYENKHINSDLLAVNFTDMSDEEFHKSLMEANLALIENYYKNALIRTSEMTRNLYINKNASFRGYRTI